MTTAERDVFAGFVLAKIDSSGSKTISLKEFRDLAKTVVERDGRKIKTSDGKPSLNWSYSFIRDYKEVLVRPKQGSIMGPIVADSLQTDMGPKQTILKH